jgi:hypothetical protein
MAISITYLRNHLYQIVDQVIDTGIPAEIERKGYKLQIVPTKLKSKLDNLVPHPGTIVGDPEDIVHLDWSHEWFKRETK